MVIGQSDDVDTETPRQPGSATAAVARLENEQLCASHQRGPHERLAARVGVIAVDEQGAWPHAPERLARRLVRFGEACLVPHQLDRGAEQRRPEWVSGQNEYVGTAHVVVPARGSGG